MPIPLLKDIYHQRPYPSRLLGLDLGRKTIGLAVSNTDQSIASAVHIIERKKLIYDLKEIEEIIDSYDIKGFVFGWPLNMDGSFGPRCDATLSFIDEFTKSSIFEEEKPWIALWDERLSTEAVEDFLVNVVDMSRKKRKSKIDKLAAQIILQGALDYMAVQEKRHTT